MGVCVWGGVCGGVGGGGLPVTGGGGGVGGWGGGYRSPVNSPHKGPVTQKMFPFDDVIMGIGLVLPKYSSHGTKWLIHWGQLMQYDISLLYPTCSH